MLTTNTGPENFRLATADDSYEATQRRREAAIILDNPELLMMHAESRQDVSFPL